MKSLEPSDAHVSRPFSDAERRVGDVVNRGGEKAKESRRGGKASRGRGRERGVRTGVELVPVLSRWLRPETEGCRDECTER